MLLAIVAYGMLSDECVRDALITRIEAFMALLTDPERQVIWASRRWVLLSEAVVGMVSPAIPLFALAATCPLRPGTREFDADEFERLAAITFNGLTRGRRS
jgi:hypothetical protein